MCRVRIVILSACLIAAITSSGLWFWSRADASVDRFVADFDRNVHSPVAAALFAQDPTFHARVVRLTADAYSSGGWPAAIDRFDEMMTEKLPDVFWVENHADDDLMLAYQQRVLATLHKLKDRPGACRYFATGYNYRIGSLPSAQPELEAGAAAARAAYLSGAKNIADGTGPDMPSEAEGDALLEKSTALGKPFTAAEWAALEHRGAGNPRKPPPDAMVCAAETKFFENLLTLPRSDAASLARYRTWRWISKLPQFANRK